MAARIPASFLLAVLLAGCSLSAVPGSPPVARTSLERARWIPAANTTYQIQYGGKLDLSVPADVYDVDYQDTTARDVAAIQDAAPFVTSTSARGSAGARTLRSSPNRISGSPTADGRASAGSTSPTRPHSNRL